MRTLVMTAAIALGTIAPAASSHAAAFSDLFVFGDSLVDSGNARAARLAGGGTDPAPPALGYFQGRFSNGYNFADDLGFKTTGGAATASFFGGHNFSVGGAQAAEVAGDQSPSFAEQIAFYQGSGQVISSNSLVLVTFGGNDVRGELAKLGANPGYQPNLTPALAALNSGLTSLVSLGARNILVTGLPDIGQIPAVTGIGNPALNGAGTQLSFGLNQAFGQAVSGLATQTGYNLRFFDLFAYQQTIYANPAAFGLPANLNKRDACLLVAGAGPACAGYVYFDTIHPTTAIHSVIADGLAALVPEPASWMIMIVGFGMVGGAIRRTRRVTAWRFQA